MKHKIHVILSLMVLSFMSCHLLSKDKLTLKKLNQKVDIQLSARRNMLSQQKELVLIDSSHNDFMMVLWPKGKFTFSVAKGFEGEAEKVWIKGKQINQKVLTLNDKKQQDCTSVQINYSGEKENSIAIEKNKFKIAPTWVWLLLLPIFYLLYFVYQKIKIR